MNEYQIPTGVCRFCLRPEHPSGTMCFRHPDLTAAIERETAWLIERTDMPEPQYAFVEDWGGFHFTPDPNKAVRFSRREDAEQVLNIFESVDAKAVEHCWP